MLNEGNRSNSNLLKITNDYFKWIIIVNKKTVENTQKQTSKRSTVKSKIDVNQKSYGLKSNVSIKNMKVN